MSARSILQCHRILSRALKVAMQRGRISRNVCALVDAPSAQRGEIDPLSQGDAKKLLTAAAGTRNTHTSCPTDATDATDAAEWMGSALWGEEPPSPRRRAPSGASRRSRARS